MAKACEHEWTEVSRSIRCTACPEGRHQACTDTEKKHGKVVCCCGFRIG